MARLDPVSGLMVDDEDGAAAPQAGSLGEQAAAPPPMPPVGQPGRLDALPLGDLPMAPGQLAPGEPPPAPVAVAPPPAGAPPGQVVTRQVTLSPEEQAAKADINAANAHAARLSESAGDARVKLAETDSAGANANAAVRAQQAAEAEQRLAQQRAREEEAKALASGEFAKWKQMGIKDPDADQSFGRRLMSAIAVGLGQYSAARLGGSNTAAQIIDAARRENIQRQQQALAQRHEAMKLTREDAGQQRQQTLLALQAKNAAQAEAIKDKWIAESKRLGIPIARIASDQTTVALEKAAAEERAKLEEATRLYSRDVTPLETARARKLAAGGAGGGGTKGPADANAMAELADFALKNPGDTAGLYRKAAELKVKDPTKAVAAIGTSTKATGEQDKHAGQAATMLRAIDQIEKLEAGKYTPSKAAWIKWQKNQDDVKIASSQADKGSLLGSFAARAGQSVGALAKDEFDGLDEKAKQYFTAVKKVLEGVGREQSGAAISRSEWDNFGGQYGLQAPGGIAAAKEYARDRLKLSGTAGKRLEEAGSLPKPEAKAKADDPRVKLAREAIADKDAPPAVKARALQILRAAGER